MGIRVFKIFNLITILIGLSLFTNAQGFELNDKFYVGTDGHYRNIEMPREFGGNVFSKHLPGANLFMGNRLMDQVAIEIGYHFTGSKISQAVINNEEQTLGVNIKGGQQHHLSKASLSGCYADLKFYYPIKKVRDNKIEAIISVGLSNTEMRYKNILLHANGMPQNINSSVLIFNAKKPIVRGGVGFQYEYCHCALRVMINYENLNRFNKIISQNSAQDYMIKLKDSFHVGIGLITYLN